VALENDIASIAFPAISTGVYRFPVLRACSIAVRTVVDFIRNQPRIPQVAFCCFGAEITTAVNAEVASF
jgi:O-acetyl-ADP-ribose deacetylase (regulator of RNase III)